MAITNKLNFTRNQLRGFAQLFRGMRAQLGLSQLPVAQRAFEHKKSHCKVSRIERVAMAKADAVAIERVAAALRIPRGMLLAIDPQFNARVAVAKSASVRGFWSYPAELASAV